MRRPKSPLTHRQAERTRDAIEATKIVKRLQAHVLGDLDMSGTQLQAATILLSYALPKPAQQVEQTGELVIRWKS